MKKWPLYSSSVKHCKVNRVDPLLLIVHITEQLILYINFSLQIMYRTSPIAFLRQSTQAFGAGI